jgi:hypothetical protein
LNLNNEYSVDRGKFDSKEGGYSYEGEWRDGRKHGTGVLIFPTGDRYDGDWENDTRQGK